MGDTVQRWTGHEARLLRGALRLTQRQFAELLDVSERSVAKWEAGSRDYQPRSLTQSLLDTALARADADAVARFRTAVGHADQDPPDGVGPAAVLRVDSHKFIPVFLGTERIARLTEIVGAPATDSWLDISVAPMWHDDADASLYLSGCGVALVHLVQSPSVTSLRDLAHWRHVSHRDDPGWVASTLAELLDSDDEHELRPGYVFSGYWLHESPWTGEHVESAVRLMASLSMLVDRRVDVGRPVSPEAEQTMIRSGLEHPDAVPVGLAGIGIGYATWSGVSYHPLDVSRSLTVEDFIDLEVTAQMMWCYARHIQAAVEEGLGPGIDEKYGWRFLRAARTRMGTARGDEWSQVRILREAIVATSGLDTLLHGAQNALREDATDTPATYLLVRNDAQRDTGKVDS